MTSEGLMSTMAGSSLFALTTYHMASSDV